ncbi:MAG TPA: GAF domain-containing protein [Cyclobacteriaceae bacterium]
MKNRALKYTVGFAVVGLIITALVFYVQRSTIKTYDGNLPFINLSDNIKNRIAVGHLWLEEAIAGDQSIDVEKDVLGRFTSSKAILQAAYDGKESEIGTFQEPKEEDAKVILKEAIFNVEKLSAIAQERWNHHKQNKSTTAKVPDSVAVVSSAASDVAGAELDQSFDAAFDKAEASMDQLNAYFSKDVKHDAAYLNTISWLSIVIIAGAFGLLGFLLFRLQRGNDKLANDTKVRMEERASADSQLSDFIESVSSGNYSVDLVLAGDTEGLTAKLITMRDKLKENSDSEKKRSWSTMGLAQVGEILRSTSTSATELYDNIIKFLVKYTKSNQGGLFILNEDEEDNQAYLELMACYAFERKKYLTKKIGLGEGLVGQCYLEGERIYLKEVPGEYISITSGLGGSQPKALLLVPMKLNDKIYGVIELATFNQYQDFEIELVEKLAETIASTISTVRINDSTRILLEKTQQQAEEMKAQEEEIRQNMEELEATQEEMRRKQTVLEKELVQSQQQAEALQIQEKKLTESQDTLQAIVDNIPRAIFWKDRDLRFMGCNKIFAQIAGVSSHLDMIGKTDFDMAWSAQAEAYRKDDMEVMKSKKSKLDIEEVNVNSEGEESWVMTSKVPIINSKNEVVSILGMFEDITIRKKKEADVAKKLVERENALKEIQELKRLLEAKG